MNTLEPLRCETIFRIKAGRAVLLFFAALMSICACHKSSQADNSKLDANGMVSDTAKAQIPPDNAMQELGEVTLVPEQIERIGLQLLTVKPVAFADEATGYGTVLSHDSPAQAVAELVSAQATAKQSQAALARMQRLSGTPGAVSADAEESAVRQVALDSAALDLVKQRLSATYGQQSPWSAGAHMALLHALASGHTQLVHATFPFSELTGDIPTSLRIAPIGATSSKHWKITTLWAAPADPNVPGRSFFAVSNGSDLQEGERLIVWAPLSATTQGVVIPRSAVVISDGRYWCYLEEKRGSYIRKVIDIHKPFEEGYFLDAGVKAGDRIVIQGAAQLLAQESNARENAD